MAMTPEQEAKLQADLAEMHKTLASIAPAVETLKTQLAEKDKAITDLQQKHALSSQEKSLLDLKTKYPDVPESVLKALPEASRDAEAKSLQDKFGQLKTASAVKTGSNAWDNAGIGPSVEAEDAAQLALREKARNEAVLKGSPMEVMRTKARDTVDFLRKHYPSAA
jgi:hypothetical protein